MSIPDREQGLQRRLTSWQLTMIAIGGAIGVGLFLGSAATIGIAGPGVLISYVLGAFVAAIMGYALAEMASVHPVAGSFGVYADKYVSPWAGLTVRLTYWFAQTVAIGAEVTAVGLYFGYWFPEVPPWVWIIGCSALVLAVNAANVKIFGVLESWLAMIKVFAIAAFIILGGALIIGIGQPAIGLSNLTAHGGFLPHGWTGVWLALTLVITSYMGIEVVAVTAGEAAHPEESVPRAMRGIVVRLIVFYLLAIFIIVTVTPWPSVAETGGRLTGSPFVKVFQGIGIPFTGSIMNFVVISAALSSVNTNLYLCSRMIFSLSRAGYVPERFGSVDSRGVPFAALAASAAGMAAAIALAVKGQQGFLLLYGIAVAAMFFVWTTILLTHIRFRQALPPDRLRILPVKMPVHPLMSIVGIVLILALAASTAFVEGLEWTVPLFLIWLALTAVFYFFRVRALARRLPS
ncbi:MAG: amino acid permease [Acidobacteria bacterium]|nr:MAG: amino acid permease [Acidobacteriota bacterium]